MLEQVSPVVYRLFNTVPHKVVDELIEKLPDFHRGYLFSQSLIIIAMRRIVYLPVLLVFTLLACQAVAHPISHFLPGIGQQPPASRATTTQAGLLSPPTEELPTLSPTAHSEITTFTVRLHPEVGLYVGDLVSLEVFPPPEKDMLEKRVLVRVDPPAGPSLGPAEFGHFGIAGQTQATLFWAWDTTAVEAGSHTLSFIVQPDGPEWHQTVTLLPASALQPSETGAHWVATETECCNIYYITHTAAERDFGDLSSMVDEQFERASQRLKPEKVEPISVVFIPRVMGHGGFTNQEVNLSYLDRYYPSNDTAIVLRHEFIHLLDSRLGGDYRPTMLVEGLAVYLSGGHYKPESLLPRAAALFDLGWYIPLRSLATDFYLSHHETGYLEAGAFVEYLVETLGWEAFSSFYRDIHTPHADSSHANAINQAMKIHFGRSLSDFEEGFLENLRTQVDSFGQRQDIRVSIDFYDAMRRYQQVYDPSAHFLSAWMVDSQQMRQRGVVADYLRHPSTPENLALETMLIAAGDQMHQAGYSKAERVLEAVNSVLSGVERGVANPFSLHPLATDYFAIVRELSTQGFQPQRIDINSNAAQAWVSNSGLQLAFVHLVRGNLGWSVLAEAQ